ncbi:thermonuclease family protein [Candidatus Omnitrophota bacterium]
MKNKKILVLVVAFVAITLPVARFLQHAGIRSGDNKKAFYVSRVIDGDTIELSNGETLRYIGIDTPELKEKIGSVWVYKPKPYAKEAKDFNQELVKGKPVRLEFDVQKRDKYRRLLAYVYSEDKMVNLEILRQGYAMIYTYPPNVKYTDLFLTAQQEARENNNGLWMDLEENIISASEAKNNIGLVRIVEAGVTGTYLSKRVLTLNCRDNFKVVIFKNNLRYFPKTILRSPDTYFKHKTIRACGLIKTYKGSCEIILHDPSQLEILR